MGIEDYHWQRLKREPDYSQKIRCKNTTKDPEIFLNVKGRSESVFKEKSGKLDGVVYNLDIRPELVFKNCLPVTIFYSVEDNWDQMLTLEPGKSAQLQGLEVGKTPLCLKIFEFRGADWRSRQVIERGMPELCVWAFEPTNSDEVPSASARFDLGINSVISRGTQVLSIYSPFWMINKTGKSVYYRGEQDHHNVVGHPVELRDAPMMFSYTGRSILGKRKTSLRIEDSAWSEPFTVDTIEDADRVTCKRKGRDNSDKQGRGRKNRDILKGITLLIHFAAVCFTPIESHLPGVPRGGQDPDEQVQLDQDHHVHAVLPRPQYCRLLHLHPGVGQQCRAGGPARRLRPFLAGLECLLAVLAVLDVGGLCHRQRGSHDAALLA